MNKRMAAITQKFEYSDFYNAKTSQYRKVLRRIYYLGDKKITIKEYKKLIKTI